MGSVGFTTAPHLCHHTWRFAIDNHGIFNLEEMAYWRWLAFISLCLNAEIAIRGRANTKRPRRYYLTLKMAGINSMHPSRLEARPTIINPLHKSWS